MPHCQGQCCPVRALPAFISLPSREKRLENRSSTADPTQGRTAHANGRTWPISDRAAATNEWVERERARGEQDTPRRCKHLRELCSCAQQGFFFVRSRRQTPRPTNPRPSLARRAHGRTSVEVKKTFVIRVLRTTSSVMWLSGWGHKARDFNPQVRLVRNGVIRKRSLLRSGM